MSELSAAPSDLTTPAASDESPRRRSAHTEGSMSSTGLMVRADLYDEEYSEDEYEQMLSMYEGTMASIAEGEIVKSKVLRITENAVILDVGFKSEGSVPLDEFKDPQNLQVGDALKASAAPWSFTCALTGRPMSRCAASTALTASPSDAPGARLNEIVEATNCEW